jgi:hypothetical protein
MARDWTAAIKATLVSGVLVAIAVGVRELKFTEPSIGLFTLLCVSFLAVFAITSGRLATVTTPGGVTATFHAFLEKDAQKVSTVRIGSPVDAHALMMVQKRGVDDIREEIAEVVPGKHAALVLQAGTHYDADAVAQYERAILRRAKTVTLVVVDERGRFVGSMRPSRREHPQLRSRVFSPRFFEQLARPDQMRENLSGLDRFAAPASISLRESLEHFVANQSEYVVILDSSGRPDSIVFRDDVILDLLAFARREESKVPGKK